MGSGGPEDFATFIQCKRAIIHLAFSPDGKLLIAIHSGTVWDDVQQRIVFHVPAIPECWDVAAGKVLRNLADHVVSTQVAEVAEFSPDGRIVALTGNGPVRLWDAASGLRWPVILKGQVATVDTIAFSPDGKTIALGTPDREVQLWDLASGQLRASFTGHTKAVSALAFSRDGRQLISGSGVVGHGWFVHGGEVKIWATDDGCRRGTLAGTVGSLKGLAFSPDGRTLAAASGPTGPSHGISQSTLPCNAGTYSRAGRMQ